MTPTADQLARRLFELRLPDPFLRPALDELDAGRVLITHDLNGQHHVHSFCPRTPMSIVRAALRLEPLFKAPHES